MSEDSFDETLDAYLMDALDPDARRAFEQRMQADPELAARVALEQDLLEALNENSAENRFRNSLKAIGEQFPSPESLAPPTESPWKRRGIIGGLFLLLLGAGYLMFRPGPPATPAPQQTPAAPVETTPTTPAPPAQEQQTAAKPSEPIAAAFRPLPALEKAIGSRMRSGDFSINMTEPAGNAVFAPNKSIKFRGVAEGTFPDDSDLNLLIFSNDPAAFEAMKPFLKQKLTIVKSGPFDMTLQPRLSPGKYYWMIENDLSGEWLYVQSFLVK
ncbi:MAG TPA: hypothetical protein VK168_20030 [Saprospiraceae bacterium]|nr:hypothetical protein [Saprospiraceae bacterium]